MSSLWRKHAKEYITTSQSPLLLLPRVCCDAGPWAEELAGGALADKRELRRKPFLNGSAAGGGISPKRAELPAAVFRFFFDIA